MHETPTDLENLQALLDRSYAGAGSHLLSIIEPARRPSAAELARRLRGMRLLALATVSAAGRPLVGPVDGVFFRGSFVFGTSPRAARWRHVLARPWVSATHLPAEEFAVTVHGRAVPVATDPVDGAELRAALLGVYVPRYGEEWAEFLDSEPVYARIEAERMFAFRMGGEG